MLFSCFFFWVGVERIHVRECLVERKEGVLHAGIKTPYLYCCKNHHTSCLRGHVPLHFRSPQNFRESTPIAKRGESSSTRTSLITSRILKATLRWKAGANGRERLFALRKTMFKVLAKVLSCWWFCSVLAFPCLVCVPFLLFSLLWLLVKSMQALRSDGALILTAFGRQNGSKCDRERTGSIYTGVKKDTKDEKPMK